MTQDYFYDRTWTQERIRLATVWRTGKDGDLYALSGFGSP